MFDPPGEFWLKASSMLQSCGRSLLDQDGIVERGRLRAGDVAAIELPAAVEALTAQAVVRRCQTGRGRYAAGSAGSRRCPRRRHGRPRPMPPATPPAPPPPRSSPPRHRVRPIRRSRRCRRIPSVLPPEPVPTSPAVPPLARAGGAAAAAHPCRIAARAAGSGRTAVVAVVPAGPVTPALPLVPPAPGVPDEPPPHDTVQQPVAATHTDNHRPAFVIWIDRLLQCGRGPGDPPRQARTVRALGDARVRVRHRREELVDERLDVRGDVARE